METPEMQGGCSGRNNEGPEMRDGRSGRNNEGPEMRDGRSGRNNEGPEMRDGRSGRNNEESEMRSGCGGRDWREEVPTGNQSALLRYIDEVSFVAYDTLLYLDSHPNDTEARTHFVEHNRKRNFALEQYEDAYGPLNLSSVEGDDTKVWKWACQPWPWEGGND
jgi:spore coat protein JB